MEEDAFFDEPAELEEQNLLKTYFNSLPYKCESVEEMQDKLKEIVEKLYICAKARNWIQLTSWDGLLQWYFINCGIIGRILISVQLAVDALSYGQDNSR